MTASKGLEIETFHSPSQILKEVFGERAICVLTGPSHAEEVARGLPASSVAASSDDDLARQVQLTAVGAVSRTPHPRQDRGAENLKTSRPHPTGSQRGLARSTKLGVY